MGAMHCAIVCHWDTPNDTCCHWAKVPLKRANGGVPLGRAIGTHQMAPSLPPRASASALHRPPCAPPPLFAILPPCSRAIWCVPLAHRSPGTPLTPALHRPPAHPPVGANGTQWHASAASAVDRLSPAPIFVPVPLFRPKLALIGCSVRCVSDFRPSGLSSHAVLQRKSSFSLPWGHATQKIGGIHRTEQPISATKRRKSGSEGR